MLEVKILPLLEQNKKVLLDWLQLHFFSTSVVWTKASAPEAGPWTSEGLEPVTLDAAEQSRLRSSIILTSTSSDSSLTSSSDDDDDVNDGGGKKRRFKEKGKKFLTKKILDKSKSLTSLKKLEGQF